MTDAKFIDLKIQHDGLIWRVLSTGARDDRGMYCHLIAVHSRKKDGTPYQVCDFVPLAVLRRGRYT
jgi:hypothetical protein